MVCTPGEKEEYHMDRRVLMVEVSGVQVQGRQRLSWMCGVKQQSSLPR